MSDQARADQTEQVWIGGGLVAADRAAVSPFDHGMTVGDGIFETLQIVRGEPFAVRRHLARLRRSASGLGLRGLPDDRALREAMAGVIEANRVSHGRLRLTVTGGISPLGSDRGDAEPSVIIATAPPPAWEATTAVVTVPWRRNEHSAVAGLKTTSYAENVVALAYAHDRGGSEAVFANTTGDLCEGTGSNVFVVVGNRLCTPPLASGCLAGITRELVFELVEVEERPLPLAALIEAEEAFLTSSTRDVQPIRMVDGVPLPAAPGPHTEAAAAAFAVLLARNIDP
jgi:branched-chain amino acid aminotransferase